MRKVCNNAYQQYVRSRPGASAESVKRVKELRISEAGVLSKYSDVSPTAADLISRMRNYRPQGVSIFAHLDMGRIGYFELTTWIFYARITDDIRDWYQDIFDRLHSDEGETSIP